MGFSLSEKLIRWRTPKDQRPVKFKSPIKFINHTTITLDQKSSSGEESENYSKNSINIEKFKLIYYYTFFLYFGPSCFQLGMFAEVDSVRWAHCVTPKDTSVVVI